MRGVWRNSLEAAAERAERRERSAWHRDNRDRSRRVTWFKAREVRLQLAAGEKHLYLATLHALSLTTIRKIKAGLVQPEPQT